MNTKDRNKLRRQVAHLKKTTPPEIKRLVDLSLWATAANGILTREAERIKNGKNRP